jgi:TetR/AcrR family transcriptional repressor of nem operon
LCYFCSNIKTPVSKGEKTRQRIIETVAPLFNEKGLAATSIKDVLKATKVAKGCLYGHFENKDVLTYAVVDYLLQIVVDNSVNAISQKISAKEKLFAYLDIYADPVNPTSASGCPIMNFGAESDGTNEVVQQKIQKAIKKLNRLFSDTIKKGIADKEFSTALNPDEFALKIFTMVEGGIVVSRVMNNHNSLKAIVEMLKKEIETYELK